MDFQAIKKSIDALHLLIIISYGKDTEQMLNELFILAHLIAKLKDKLDKKGITL